MKYKLHWNNEEEGTLTFFDKDKTEWFCLDIFIVGDEAELVIKNGDFVDECNQQGIVCEKNLKILEDCIWKSFSLLWKRGIEDVFLVGKQTEPLIQCLNRANIIETAYSEYMMKRTFSIEDKLDNSIEKLIISTEEDSFVCENKDKSFFCSLLPYQEKNSFYLYEVEVMEKVRNRGIATKCLQQLFFELIKKSESKEGITIYLQVGSYNEPAVHLYQKLGFELSEEICYNVLKEE